MASRRLGEGPHVTSEHMTPIERITSIALSWDLPIKRLGLFRDLAKHIFRTSAAHGIHHLRQD